MGDGKFSAFIDQTFRKLTTTAASSSSSNGDSIFGFTEDDFGTAAIEKKKPKRVVRSDSSWMRNVVSGATGSSGGPTGRDRDDQSYNSRSKISSQYHEAERMQKIAAATAKQATLQTTKAPINGRYTTEQYNPHPSRPAVLTSSTGNRPQPPPQPQVAHFERWSSTSVTSFSNKLSENAPGNVFRVSEGLIGDYHWKKYPQSALLQERTSGPTEQVWEDREAIMEQMRARDREENLRTSQIRDLINERSPSRPAPQPNYVPHNSHHNPAASNKPQQQKTSQSMPFPSSIDFQDINGDQYLPRESSTITRMSTPQMDIPSRPETLLPHKKLSALYEEALELERKQGTVSSKAPNHSGGTSNSNRSDSQNSGDGKCSVFETCCNMVSLITGSGMLSLPYAAAQMGYSAAGALLLLASCYMYSFTLVVGAIEAVAAEQLTVRPSLLSKNGHHNGNSNISRHHSNGHYGALAASDPLDNVNGDDGFGLSSAAGQNRNYGEVANLPIDYLTLGRAAFGRFGGSLVALSLSIELFLALVSFFINIGINLSIVNPGIDCFTGIVLAAVISLVMSGWNLRLAAYSSALGVAMTSLTIGSLLLSGIRISSMYGASSGSSSGSIVDSRAYESLKPGGLPLSIGLICFCFGGHAAYPPIYNSMKDQSQAGKATAISGGVIVSIYIAIMMLGYVAYAQYSQAPVTLNVGRNLTGVVLPDGHILQVAAALGITFNLQVTCPLVMYPLRDLLLKIRASDESGPDISNDAKFTMSGLIILCAMFTATVFRDDFVRYCSLVGIFATSFNSIILPVCFYHCLYIGFTSWRVRLLHFLLLSVCLASASLGVFNSI